MPTAYYRQSDPLFARQGWVYVLVNPYLKAPSGLPLLKIGATRKHPLQRAQELGASTGVPGQFKIAYYRDFADCFRAETAMHRLLVDRRVNQSREFFDLPIDDAIHELDELARSGGMESSGLTPTDLVEKNQTRLGEAGLVQTPWALLFNSFTPSDDPNLNEEERRQCSELAIRLQQQQDLT